MSEQKQIKTLRASITLMMYKEPKTGIESWFWMSTDTGKVLSPHFTIREDAENWFRTVDAIRTEATDLMVRTMYGKFYKMRARVPESFHSEYIFMPHKKGEHRSAFVQDGFHKPNTTKFQFPIKMMGDDTIEVIVLGKNLEDARKRVEEVIKIVEWIE